MKIVCGNSTGWGLRSFGKREPYRKGLDLDTLVGTRGPDFPLSRLEFEAHVSSSRRPQATVMFEQPTDREVRSG